jgi:hypothetical protein
MWGQNSQLRGKCCWCFLPSSGDVAAYTPCNFYYPRRDGFVYFFFTMLAVEGNFCAIHFFPALPAGFFFYARGLLPLASSLFTGCLAPCMRPACPPTAVSSPFSSRTSALSWDAQLATPACLTGSCGCSSCQSFIVALGPSCLYSGRCPVLTFAGFVMYVASPIAVSMIDD